MIELKEKCTECSHHATCKYSEIYNDNYDKISNYVESDEQFGDICTIEVTCKYFEYLHKTFRKPG